MDSQEIFSAPARRFFPFSGERGAILLESQCPDVRDRYSYVLRNPVSLLSTSSVKEVTRILEEATARQMEGFAVAGFVISPGFLRFDHLLRRWESSGSVDWPEEERRNPPPSYGDPIDLRFSFTETEYGIKVEEIRP